MDLSLRLPVPDCFWKLDHLTVKHFSLLGCDAMQFCMQLTFQKNLHSSPLRFNTNISTAGSSDIWGIYVQATMKTSTLKHRLDSTPSRLDNIFPLFFTDSMNIQKSCLQACIVVVVIIKSNVQQAVPTNRGFTLWSSLGFQMLTVPPIQKIPCILWNMKDHYCVQNPPLVPIQRPDSPIHTWSYFFSDQL